MYSKAIGGIGVSSTVWHIVKPNLKCTTKQINK